ncbi:MAG: AAA family ATPase [Deltaproteobacteria bacterium]|nr:AAA family ATPase [Deltaproteobacteria bacterium]
MYKHFFGFKERPFKLVPNPEYLFLSRSHREAMAHLVYAVGQGEGFVAITGEVGTGKTTLCRAFLDNLDEDTEAAYIFNPIPDAVQLIKAINEEFEIDSEPDNVMGLIRVLNRFLMKKKADGKDVILLIDEAQNLTRATLEQVRLLSNLETTRSELIQIILVGQPELRKILDSHELRQLKQRITLSFKLAPLTSDETSAYVKHRLEVAAGGRKIDFKADAIHTVYGYSKGIPRLINVACDRTLLTAYSRDQKTMSGRIARLAIRELKGRTGFGGPALGSKMRKAASLAALLLLLTTVFITAALIRSHLGGNISNRETVRVKISEGAQTVLKPVTANPLNLPESPENVEAIADRGEDDGSMWRDILRNTSFTQSRSDAFKVAMNLWHPDVETADFLETPADDLAFFRVGAKQNGFMLYHIGKDLDLVEKLNLPAILKFRTSGEDLPAFLLLSRIENEYFYFTGVGDGPNGALRATRDDIMEYWTGDAYIPWKNFFSINAEIPGDPPDESLITLKLMLRDIGYKEIDATPMYDTATRTAVRDVQLRNGLPVDGIVGSMTKIALYNENEGLGIPHLRPAAGRKIDKTHL